MKPFLLVMVFLSALPAAAQKPATSQASPTLNATLQWMQNTRASDSGSLYITGGKDGSVEKRELTMPEAKACQVSFTYRTGPLEKGSYGIITKPTFDLRETFNFKDMDPKAITVGEPTKGGLPKDIMGPYVIFFATTRDNAKLISAVTMLNPDTVSESYTTDTFTFGLPYPYSERFSKAFKRAVALCGGKPSSF